MNYKPFHQRRLDNRGGLQKNTSINQMHFSTNPININIEGQPSHKNSPVRQFLKNAKSVKTIHGHKSMYGQKNLRPRSSAHNESFKRKKLSSATGKGF